MSLQKILKRRQQSQFIGRETQLDRFRQNLTLSPKDSGRRFFFNIYGQGGVGKTFLLKQFQQLAAEVGAVSANTDEDEGDIPEVMGRIAQQFETKGHQLGEFKERYQTYLQCLKKLEANPEKPQGLSNLVGQTAAKVGMSFGRKVPGVDVALDFVDEDGVAKQVGEWTAFVVKALGNKDEVHLVQKPVEVLTPLFFKGLEEIAKKHPLALFFDTYERTGKYLDEWLRDWLEGRYGDVPENIVVAIAGRDQLNRSYWADYESLLVRLPLEPFTEGEARDYLIRKGITEASVVEAILKLSGHLPLLLNTLAVNAPSDPTTMIDATDNAVKRFLQWVEDDQRKQLALAGAIPRRFNRDVLAVLVGEEQAKAQFEWLIEMPFVVKKSALIVKNRADWGYHPVVRELMLRYKYQRSPQEWGVLQGKLADYYQDLAQNLGLDEEKATRDPIWQGYQLELLYHHLCQSPQQYLIPTWQQFLTIFHHHRELASFWAEAIQEAGEATGNEAVLRWGKLLVEGVIAYDTAPYQPAIKLFTAFLEEITEKQLQARLYFWRGNAYRRMGEEEQGIEDFNRALALYNELGDEEQLAVTVAHRGIASMQRGDGKEAVADLNRAIELQPNYYGAVASRGILYLRREDYDRALADFNRVLEENPEYTAVLVSRGIVYRQMGQYELALQDFEQVLGAIPDDAMTLTQRGKTYQDMEDYEKVLANFNRVLQLNPTNEEIYASRGAVYQQLGNYQEALIDFSQALQSNPNDAETLANRGETYRKLGQYSEALADLNRAIELNGEDSWALASRGNLYRQQGNFQRALVDLDKAVRLDGENDWWWYCRGFVYGAMGNVGAMARDLERAISLVKDSVYLRCRLNLGLYYLAMGRMEEADQIYRSVVGKASGWQMRNARGELEEFLSCFPSVEGKSIKLLLKGE